MKTPTKLLEKPKLKLCEDLNEQPFNNFYNVLFDFQNLVLTTYTIKKPKTY